MQLVEVGLLQPVTSLSHHVRYVLIEFMDLDVFFSLSAREDLFNGLCVGVPFFFFFFLKCPIASLDFESAWRQKVRG